MVKYVNFLTGDPDKQTAYDHVLKRSSFEDMWQPRLKAELDSNGNPGFTTDIGLIFFIDTRGGRKLIGHGGDQNGFVSYIDLDPIKKSASILVVNTNVIYPQNTRTEEVVYDRLRRESRRLF